ncbi:DeoR/GlpR transcriptional regulator [Pseudonocardia sp. C8]|uniref:DeoR/GlpR family DNA-binding transcription regulator n=1 Tax=Pseudonocardia sp. C8 TaxID=2762759 RepID=UPI00164251D6|nr:DeoR/GlpR family DNA-binding transcription regulator [Pseudonocardia sp. C8]MBC3191229.1 DeoR/GlpR transcriptional regulator [Pseudonocardia sp. C8]
MSLLAEQRREVIVERVRSQGAVRVSELAEHLGVSEMTVRRDLDVLARRRLVDKVHGGATAIGEHTTEEPGFSAKSVRELEEKDAIAAEAARLVTPGSAVGLSAGTTTWRLAHRLARIPRLTVVTNSLAVAEALHTGGAESRGTTVILTGGVRTPSEALVGPVAIAALRSLNLEIVFLGVHGMSAAAGFSTPNLTERDTNRALVDAGQQLVVVADHTKWGTVGISTIAELGEADVLVTDSGLADADRAVLEGEVDRVVIARTARPGRQ